MGKSPSKRLNERMISKRIDSLYKNAQAFRPEHFYYSALGCSRK